VPDFEHATGNFRPLTCGFGAPKGIRILIVLVAIGTTWDSLALKSCGESQ